MGARLRRRPAVLLMSLALAASLPLSPPALAAEGEAQAAPKAEPVPSLRDRAYKRINRARELAEQKKCEEALESLESLRTDSRANDYEKALAWSTTAYCQQELKQIERAILAQQEVLALEQIPASLRSNTQYGLAQLYLSQERWAEAAEQLELWFTSQPDPGSSAYTLLGQVYYQLKDYKRARQPMEKAIEVARIKGERVKENLYLLLRAIYYADNDYPRLAEVLKNLVQDYPKRDYWMQLAAVYSLMEQPLKQTAALEAARLQGFFTQGNDYITLAQVYLASGAPLKAAEVLREGFDQEKVETSTRNLRLLADAYVLAKEYDRAIETLKLAAGPDAEIDLRLAQLYMETGQWLAAAETARTALKKGGLAREDVAHIVAGLSLFELKRLDEAKAAFVRAAADERSRKMAEQWQGFIQREQDRLAALEAQAQLQAAADEAG